MKYIDKSLKWLTASNIAVLTQLKLRNKSHETKKSK